MTTYAWFAYAGACPVCGGGMHETNDNSDDPLMVCSDEGCSTFRQINVEETNSLHLVVELDRSVAGGNERTSLNMLKHCSKCEGPLGAAGPLVVCDGLRCGGYMFRSLGTERYLEMVGKKIVERYL